MRLATLFVAIFAISISALTFAMPLEGSASFGDSAVIVARDIEDPSVCGFVLTSDGDRHDIYSNPKHDCRQFWNPIKYYEIDTHVHCKFFAQPPCDETGQPPIYEVTGPTGEHPFPGVLSRNYYCTPV
ncbi:hypothetical protein BDV96DRAFT_688245 [Lophiotrema nucula]|uniref:Uncharacterized protein n=1 Tax=Lophiotrema nucula TaxID=690887 RepID=A0A6A5Z3K1_9PLEO|nr:hypothetical protein BDV96DRAFT_688245 [Lophiotrema nucula]